MSSLQERLRAMVQRLRRTPAPIAEVIPMLQEAADALDARAERAEAAQRVPLTDEQILSIAGSPMTAPCSPWWLKDDVILDDIRQAAIVFARAVELQHGIGAEQEVQP